MTDQELKDLVASLAVSQKETDRQLRETDRQLRETDKQLAELRLSQQETDRQLKETDRQLRKQLKELGKQIGGLGDKFGSFTEGLALPSMANILRRDFGMEVVMPRVMVRKEGEAMELDVLAYANGSTNSAYIVEVKSHLRPESLLQMQQIMVRFRRFFPEHQDKKLYGLFAVVDAAESLRQEALEHGFYMAGIHDGQFALQTPAGFVPKSW